MVVRRSDQHGVHILAGHDVAIADELLHVAAVPFLAVGRGLLARNAPGVGHGHVLDVLGLVVLVDAHHVRPMPRPPQPIWARRMRSLALRIRP